MIRASKENEAAILNFLPAMNEHMHQWQIVTLKLPVGDSEVQDKALNELLNIYSSTDGLLFTVRDYKIVMVIRLGTINNYGLLKNEIGDKIPNHRCRIVARKMNITGLKKIQLDLADLSDGDELSMYEERDERAENVFLVCEDDMFVRKSLVKLLEASGTVYEVESGAGVCAAYLQYNPDVVLLDIHMPEQDGLSIVNDLIDLDTDAFIIMISADSSEDNVLEAVSCGSVGFLSKPIQMDKLDAFQRQCITFRSAA